MTPRHTHSAAHTSILWVVTLLVLCCIQQGLAQADPVVTTAVDTTSIRIGEEIKYTVTAEVDQTATVVFPEGQTFSPLEVIESYKVDTAFAKAPNSKGNYKMTLVKKYGLTQFDSGSYKIPRQRIIVGTQTIETDSFKVEVANVVLDTVNQGLYDIKPAIEIPKNYGKLLLQILAWVIPLALAIGLFLYWLLRRHKKKKEEERYIPPFEQALATLKSLDDSGLIENSQYKAYYTTLTDAIRRYYDEKVYDRALESTTEELINRLQAERESGHIDFSPETIKNLKDIFQRADLVKFARINPPEGKALADRIAIEQIVKQTKEVLPAPTEEELMRDEMYRMAIERRRKRKLWLTGAGGVLGILVLALGIGIAIKGFSEVKDFVLGNATRELAEGQWITSEYGAPGMIVSTPKALERQNTPIPEEIKGKVETTAFAWATTPPNVTIAVFEFKIDKSLEITAPQLITGQLAQFEAQGFNAGLTKEEEFKTLNGIAGLKVFGTGTQIIDKEKGTKTSGEYALITFQAKDNRYFQLFISWKDDDPYSKKIAERVINSIDFTKNNDEK